MGQLGNRTQSLLAIQPTCQDILLQLHVFFYWVTSVITGTTPIKKTGFSLCLCQKHFNKKATVAAVILSV